MEYGNGANVGGRCILTEIVGLVVVAQSGVGRDNGFGARGIGHGRLAVAGSHWFVVGGRGSGNKKLLIRNRAREARYVVAGRPWGHTALLRAQVARLHYWVKLLSFGCCWHLLVHCAKAVRQYGMLLAGNM